MREDTGEGGRGHWACWELRTVVSAVRFETRHIDGTLCMGGQLTAVRKSTVMPATMTLYSQSPAVRDSTELFQSSPLLFASRHETSMAPYVWADD